jgi:hypothetical protein
MKKVIFLTFLSVFIGLIACQKETSERTNELTASKTTAIRRGEPVVFAMAAAQNGQTVRWTVRPDAGVQINTSGHKASIRFAFAGQYTVSGIAGADSASTPVIVTDSVYQAPDSTSWGDTTSIPGECTTCPPPDTVAVPPVMYLLDTLRFSATETLQLTLSVIDSNGATGLSIMAITTESYLCNGNALVSSVNSSQNPFQLNYPGILVWTPSRQTDQRKATVRSPIILFPIAEGRNSFSVVLNYKTYVGSFVKTGNTYAFTWPYSSGVTITPKIVK